MRSNSERIEAAHSRAAQIRREKRRRQTAVAQTVSFSACLAVVIAFAFFVYGVKDRLISEAAPAGMRASIFAGSGVLGFITVAVIAFMLGVSVTVFCFRLKKHQDEKDDGDGR